ncbi:MAG: AmmeMemoRadiSam system protein A [Phycisphaeraceae bacterium]
MAASSIADARLTPDGDGHPAHWPESERRRLLEVARASVRHGVHHGEPLEVDPATHPPRLRAPLAVFVTLLHTGSLRGCVGSLEPMATVVEETARHAYAAAFEDPRFAPLSAGELPGLDVELSVLDAPQPMPFADEADLLAQLRPGVDGLIVTCGDRRGTFLPAVWDHLPEPADFLAGLKAKAGLPADPLPREAAVHRYTATKLR